MGFLPNPAHSAEVFTRVLRAVLSSQNNKVSIDVLKTILAFDDFEKVEDLVSAVKEVEVYYYNKICIILVFFNIFRK